MSRTLIRFLASLGAVVALALALGASPTSAQLLSYDGFGNGPLPNLAGSTGGSGWTSAWAAAGDNLTQIAGPGLSYPGLATTPGAAVTPAAGGVWPNSVYQRAFQAPPAGTNAIYVSFLMRDDAAWGIWGGTSFGTYPYEMTVGSPLGWYTYGLMLSEGLGDTSSKPLIQGETTLVVVRISRNTPAAGVTYRMYLDPTVGGAEPGFADATYGIAAVSTLPGFISIDNGTGFTTDEIRVGTTWASVLPVETAWLDLGLGKVGSNGVPKLAGSGPLSRGSANQLALTSAAPSAVATLVFGLSAINAPFKGGMMVPLPQLLIVLATNAAGAATLPFTMPSGLPGGSELYFQFWIADAGASNGFSASNGLRGLTP